MHRSSSGIRLVKEEQQSQNSTAGELPTYNPRSHVAMKEQSRIRSAESAVHLIPVLLVLCAIALWFFSDPSTPRI